MRTIDVAYQTDVCKSRELQSWTKTFSGFWPLKFVIFKPLSYCSKETIGFDVKASFASRP